MKVSLVQIGNSRGVRLPKAVLEQCGFGDSVEMTVDRGKVVLAPLSKPREGWEEAFAADPAGELTKEEREWIGASFDHDEWK